MIAKATATYREAFTAFYESLVDVHPEQFGANAPRRIGSTFRVPGAGGLDAQTFYMRHVLDLVFSESQVVQDLIALARAAYRGTDPTQDVIDRVARIDGLHDVLGAATSAASSLTGKIGDWKEGTDLFANIMTNTDCALQMVGIFNTGGRSLAASTAHTMDQSSIDALFG